MSKTMSKTNSPVSTMFDLQRSAIEQTHEAVRQGVETQRRFGEALVDFGPATQANERSYDAVRTVVDGYFDAVETAMPDQQNALDEIRAAVDERFDTHETDQIEAIETLEANVRAGSESADDLLEENVAALDEQFEAVLDAHVDIEDQTVEAVEGFEGDLEELRIEFEANSEEIVENFEAHLEQFEEQVAEMQQQIEDVSGEMADTAEEVDTAEEQVEVQVEAEDDYSLEAIDGLGPTYAGRLHEEGIESLEALAEATVDTVARVADVSEAKAETWIDAAQLQA